MTPPKTPAERAAEKLATCGLLSGVTVVLHGSEDRQKLKMVSAIITAEYASIEQEVHDLRYQLTSLAKEYEASDGDLRQEIKRLREALERITAYPTPCRNQVAWEMQDIAQQALATDKRGNL